MKQRRIEVMRKVFFHDPEMAFSYSFSRDDDVLGMSWWRRQRHREDEEENKNRKTDIRLIERREWKPDGMCGIVLSKIEKQLENHNNRRFWLSVIK